MSFIEEGTLLWKPSAPWLERANIETYVKELEKRTNEQFPDYASLWQWSVTEIEQFWESIWDYFDVTSTTPYDAVLTSRTMPGAKWFTNAHINYTEHIFKQKNNDDPAIIHCTETRQLAEVSWEKLYNDTAQMQHTLKELGVQKGDRVVAYVANTYESVVAFLATASLGAIWSSASPDFGTQSVIDRFSQIEPKVMFTIDGYTYGGKPFDRTDVVSAIQKKLPTLEATIVIPYLQKKPDTSKLMEPIMWEDATSRTNNPILTYEYVEFNEPLWILFSSGTTGRPKPIVQSQGGILLEHYKAVSFHVDLHRGDRFFWYTTTGWMMWNFLVGGLLAGSTIILYDGNPQYPHAEFLWELAERTKMNIFGTSASYITHTMKSGISPKETYDLQHLRSISSTGSPLPPEGFAWCYEHVKKDLWIASISGGTDVCTA
ncbi:MAG TPA: acetoacetate--CoA ligase, partial [Pseudogracilibacillus sp.]|nr:acetoacetate--CoA ligase [Pseudogracilibacillus sp.]